MKLFILSALLCLIAAYGCKKSDPPKVYKTMTIAISNVPSGGGFAISCVDAALISSKNTQPTPFFSQTGIVNATYTTTVYSSETVDFNDNFIVNDVYRPGAIANLSIDGVVVLTTKSNEDSGFHSIKVN